MTSVRCSIADCSCFIYANSSRTFLDFADTKALTDIIKARVAVFRDDGRTDSQVHACLLVIILLPAGSVFQFSFNDC